MSKPWTPNSLAEIKAAVELLHSYGIDTMQTRVATGEIRLAVDCPRFPEALEAMGAEDLVVEPHEDKTTAVFEKRYGWATIWSVNHFDKLEHFGLQPPTTTQTEEEGAHHG